MKIFGKFSYFFEQFKYIVSCKFVDFRQNYLKVKDLIFNVFVKKIIIVVWYGKICFYTKIKCFKLSQFSIFYQYLST